MHPDSQSARGIGRGEACRHRKARAEAFGGREDIGLDAGPLVSVQAPGATDSRLHFVEDEKEIALVTDFAQTLEKGVRNHPNAALALNRLDQDCGRLRRDRGLDGGKVRYRNLIEAFDLGAEALKIFLLTARGDGGEGAPVEGALEGQDAIALGVTVNPLASPRHLDRRLIRLGPGIGEEDKVGESGVDEAPGKSLALGILVEVGDVPEFRPLPRQRLDEMGMRMADRGDGDSGAEIEIALARRRDEPGALATVESDVSARVSRYDRRSRLSEGHRLHSKSLRGSGGCAGPTSQARGPCAAGKRKIKTPPRWDGRRTLQI